MVGRSPRPAGAAGAFPHADVASMPLHDGPSPSDQVFRLLERAIRERPDVSLAELGGLSPLQVWRLLSADWEGEGSAVWLDEGLELEDMEGARTVHNARAFLGALLETDGTRATSAGNLNRAFVEAMVERLAWRPGFVEDLREWTRVLNEADVRPLHTLRVVLELAGLVRRTKGAFRATRRAERLLPPEAAGRLLALLFRTFFRELNLAWLDRANEAHAFQETVAFALYRFGVVAGEWRSPEELAGELCLPSVRDAVPAGERHDSLALILEMRFLDPLEGFGLAELREECGESRRLPRRFYRKTKLFGWFLDFEV